MKKKIILTVGIILVLAGLVMGGIGLRKYLQEKNAGNNYEDLRVEFDVNPAVEIPEMDDGPVEVPVDFKSLAAQYPDIYAWIYIPGTNINYPILQREGNDEYYLNHTYDGRQRVEGAIFTDSEYNKKDFKDANTVIYGHNMKNGSMFQNLHKYKNKQFFQEHTELYIYQEGRILRYRIFAAYVYDSRHLMMSFDFENPFEFDAYLNSVLTKKDMSSNIDTTVSVTSDDYIITLSTCNNNPAQRYLVQAVLLSIQE